MSILAADGSMLMHGDSALTITVYVYSDVCDLSGCGCVSSWEDHAVEFPDA